MPCLLTLIQSVRRKEEGGRVGKGKGRWGGKGEGGWVSHRHHVLRFTCRGLRVSVFPVCMGTVAFDASEMQHLAFFCAMLDVCFATLPVKWKE